MRKRKIIILGIGNILFSDEGFGIRVVETIKERYNFDDNVLVIDGGVLGINLMGIVSEADDLIVVDAIKNKGNPGDIHRIEGNAIPERIRAKNSLHQIDFLESLTLCQVLDKTPKTTIIGIEPEDIETLSCELTKVVLDGVNKVIEKIMKELKEMKVFYEEKNSSRLVEAAWKSSLCSCS